MFKNQATIFPKVLPRHSSYFERKDSLLQDIMMDQQSHLARGIKEMIAAIISKADNCDYCFKQHLSTMQDYGIDYDTASQLMFDYKSSTLEEKFKVLLSFCEELIINNEFDIFDYNFSGLEQYGWTLEEIFEAIILSYEINSMNKIVLALKIQDDDLSSFYRKRVPIQKD